MVYQRSLGGVGVILIARNNNKGSGGGGGGLPEEPRGSTWTTALATR